LFDSALFLISLCNLCVIRVSVVIGTRDITTTEAQRTQRLHREEFNFGALRFGLMLSATIPAK